MCPGKNWPGSLFVSKAKVESVDAFGKYTWPRMLSFSPRKPSPLGVMPFSSSFMVRFPRCLDQKMPALCPAYADPNYPADLSSANPPRGLWLPAPRPPRRMVDMQNLNVVCDSIKNLIRISDER